MRPVIHALVHVGNKYSLRAYYVPGTVHTGKAAVSKTDKNPCPRGMHIFVLILRKMKSGTVSSGFSKGSNKTQVHPFPFQSYSLC